ncbi:MAG: phosphotransferase [Albidovulum sp.]|uniref:aminoglycoside phosphotransferase family protein n=1 Tax=Albidovulum sp. TaxID=1872424 RepID=UPI003C91B500
MTMRAEQEDRFLAHSGWAGAVRTPLAGDASARRYQRLFKGAERAVLMDAPPDRGEDTGRFSRMAFWLRDRSYSAPDILAEDRASGFLLLEDLGEDLFARLISANPAAEQDLYTAAVDFLIDLHRYPAAEFVAPLDGPALADLVELTPKWYLPGVGEAPNDQAGNLPRLVSDLCARIAGQGPVTGLRDFHAENLIWLPDRTGIAQVGLLDFQDAVATHPAYDLVSLLQDARRDVPLALERAMVDRYLTTTGLGAEAFGFAYALLGAQRALRIIGVFARLTLHFGKPHYLGYMPRVWGYLLRNLAHPGLAALNDAVRAGLPEPVPERMQRMMDQCGQYPTP